MRTHIQEPTTRGVQGKRDESIRLVSSVDLTVQLVDRSEFARTVERLFVSFNAGAGGVGGGAASGRRYKETGTSSLIRFIVRPDGCPLEASRSFSPTLKTLERASSPALRRYYARKGDELTLHHSLSADMTMRQSVGLTMHRPFLVSGFTEQHGQWD
jgi:hypothetical protein